ncbi:MAG: hypothetical protein HYV07_28150 [Deltaproteobacteria bacterium]|nr:hypothetical protein [Deltaproteobacteria bacterium]
MHYRTALLALAVSACDPPPGRPCDKIEMSVVQGGSALVPSCDGTGPMLFNPDLEYLTADLSEGRWVATPEAWSSAHRALRLTEDRHRELGLWPGNIYYERRALVEGERLSYGIRLEVKVLKPETRMTPLIKIDAIDSQNTEGAVFDPTKPLTVYDHLYLQADIEGKGRDEVEFGWTLAGSDSGEPVPRLLWRTDRPEGIFGCSELDASRRRCVEYQPLSPGRLGIVLEAATFGGVEQASSRMYFDVVETAFTITPDQLDVGTPIHAEAKEAWDGQLVTSWEWRVLALSSNEYRPYRRRETLQTRSGRVVDFDPLETKTRGISLDLTLADGSKRLVEHMFRPFY